MQQYKGDDNFKLVPNLSYSYNLVKIRIVFRVSNLASILFYLFSLWRYWSFFVGTLDSCSRFLKHITFLVKTKHYNFAELRPFCKQLEMLSILDSLEKKKNPKIINNGFGTKIEIENIQLF